MFLNFPLHILAQAFCGVDLTFLFDEELKDGQKTLWEKWTRCLMGAKPSPYQSIKVMLWAEDFARDIRKSGSDPFRLAYVKLNLPGSRDYDPTLPWIAKMKADGSLATEFFIYVDDVRVTGGSEEDVWEPIRRLCSIFGYLDIQDAARKRRNPNTRPGAWARSMVYLEEGCVGVYVDQKKWDKTRVHLFWIKEQVDNCQGPADIIRGDDFGINYKELEKRRGFLVYMSRTYPLMVPYLKGIHQTLDGWGPGRANDGWKLMHAEIKAANMCILALA